MNTNTSVVKNLEDNTYDTIMFCSGKYEVFTPAEQGKHRTYLSLLIFCSLCSECLIAKVTSSVYEMMPARALIHAPGATCFCDRG